MTLAWLLLAVAACTAPSRAPSARASSGDPGLALVLDLCAAGLRAGRPLADAIEATAPVAAEPLRLELGRIAGLLRLGTTAERAWSGVEEGSPLGEVAPVAIRSAASGVRLADAFEQLAIQVRADAAAGATARAHRAGIWAMGPLGACFLPAFVCLGIVPIVVGIARTALGAAP